MYVIIILGGLQIATYIGTTWFGTIAEGMPGQSGAPVQNSNGDVVGIYTYSANQGFHVDLNTHPGAYNFCTRVTSTLKSFIN